MGCNSKQGIGKTAATTFAAIGPKKMLIIDLELSIEIRVIEE
jgi:hypothetical protein